MIFSSLIFLFLFLPVFLAIFYLSPNKNTRLLTVFIFSFLFYYWGELNFVLLLLFSSLLDFSISSIIDRNNISGKVKYNRLYLLVSVVVNLSILMYFKYYSFFYNEFISLLNIENNSKLISIALPLGISFFTFQSMSYTIDVYMKKVKPSKSVLEYLAYIMMFPQLVAGPIVRFAEIEQQLRTFNRPDVDSFYYGLKRFIIGFVKKTIIANSMAPVADLFFSMPPSELSFVHAWYPSELPQLA